MRHDRKKIEEDKRKANEFENQTTITHLSSKSFVDFPNTNVIDSKVVALQQFDNRIGWAQQQFFGGIHASKHVVTQIGTRLHATVKRSRFACHKRSRCTIGEE